MADDDPAGPSPQQEQKKKDFVLHRTTPQERATPAGGPPPLAMLVVLVAIAGGVGYLFFAGDKTGDDTPTTVGTNGPTAPPVKDVELPDYILERLDFKETQDVESALAYAEEQLEEYPNAELRSRIAQYRQELGLEEQPARPLKVLLQEAQAALKKRQYDVVVELCDEALEVDEDSAEAYFLMGVAKGEGGQPLAAINDLNSAKALGKDEALVEKQIDRFQ